MTLLIVGLALFLGIHSVRMVPGLRPLFVSAIGAGGYKLLYTLLSVIGLALIIYGKIQAHPTEILWYPPEWSRTLAFVAIPLGLVLIIAAQTPSHIRKFLRHPMLIGVILWSGAHLAANGEKAAIVLFGSFFVWSVLATLSAFMRGGHPDAPKGWGGDVTALVIGALLAAAFARFHSHLFGVGVIG